ncbi:hypothetical protein [Metabacillus indicus]|uniref:Polymerase beta nucleotidyltransferase domain-containing protein n=2 Tax=Metabacillus indicus TaxID=246786 RepID=A0A084GNI9_METID|nr:hypothetical protein [Metabacillus indicus]KEZ48901.1 hypothetical protein GS18_0215900 [Metabacillus indicus]KEZ49228.1 hypothetical protein AZ46_0214245 [Metabacillus indicus LMG 22858]
MVEHFWITCLQKEIKKNNKLLFLIENEQMRIFLFGSAKNNKSPNDLDLLLTYNNEVISLEEISKIKKELKTYFYSLDLGITIDLLFLSYIEERQISFVRKECALKIY